MYRQNATSLRVRVAIVACHHTHHIRVHKEMHMVILAVLATLVWFVLLAFALGVRYERNRFLTITDDMLASQRDWEQPWYAGENADLLRDDQPNSLVDGPIRPWIDPLSVTARASSFASAARTPVKPLPEWDYADYEQHEAAQGYAPLADDYGESLTPDEEAVLTECGY